MKYITIFYHKSTLCVYLYQILYTGPIYNQAQKVIDASRYLGVKVPDALTCMVVRHISEVAWIPVPDFKECTKEVKAAT